MVAIPSRLVKVWMAVWVVPFVLDSLTTRTLHHMVEAGPVGALTRHKKQALTHRAQCEGGLVGALAGLRALLSAFVTFREWYSVCSFSLSESLWLWLSGV